MWWEVVFPSLLPFFVVSELMIGLGVVRFIGVLLEPLMRPLFHVPGVGGFVWAMGMASGFPAGAKFTARLRQENQLTAIEAERLVAFTNSSNPLFMGGAIAVGFFHDAALGVVLIASHYLGNFCVGLTMRYHGVHQENRSKKTERSFPSIKKAFHEMHQTIQNDQRPFGKLLGDSVNRGIQTLLMIGGFIILFSVLQRLLSIVNIAQPFTFALGKLLSLLGIPSELSESLFSGLFEITIGSQMASETEQASLLYQIMITSFILAFNGFSVQAQVASILAETDIRFRPFLIARLIHGLFAMMFTALLWNPLYVNIETNQKTTGILAVFSHQHEQASNFFTAAWSFLTASGPIITLACLVGFIIFQLKTLAAK